MLYKDFIKEAFDLEGDAASKENEQLVQQVDQRQSAINSELAQKELEESTHLKMKEIEESALANKRLIDSEFTSKALSAIETFNSEMEFLEGKRKNKQFFSNSISEASASKVLKEVDAESQLLADLQKAQAEQQMSQMAAQQNSELPPSETGNRVNRSSIAQGKKDQEEAQAQAQEQQMQQAQQAGQAQPQAQDPGSKDKNEAISDGSQQEVVGGGASSGEAPKIAGDMSSKIEVSYLAKSPIGNRSCSFCESFSPESKSCKKVSGDISSSAVCKLFTRKK